jgi:hypothetical protein
MNKLWLYLPVGLVGLGLLPSQQFGIGPGSVYAVGMPGCGSCHVAWMNGLPGGNNLAINVSVASRVLTPSQTISVTTSATGGDPDPKQWGGFLGFADRGTFIPGVRSQNYPLSPLNNDITHTQPDTMGGGRTWTFGYKAPTTAGLVNMFMAVNTVNGDGKEVSGDNWGFHGFDSAAQDSTPVRLYVNATGIAAKGTACAGGYNQVPVLGSKTVPAIGNANFAFEGHGLAPSSASVLFLAANPAWIPLDLSIIGVPGCTAEVDPSQISIGATTTPGIARRAEGTATIALPIPNDPTLRGQRFDAQLAVVDVNNGRAVPITLTNGLSITVQ